VETFKLKKGLGRGLSSLIGDSKVKNNINKLPIHKLVRNKFQPRKIFNKESLEDLTNSIRERGIIQPIVVRPSNDENYEIIAGERRWLASQKAGLHEVPVVLLEIDDVKSLEFSIVENVQRQDLNPIEEAQGYQRLIDGFSYNQEKISKFIGKSRSHIANSLRLLNLPKEVILLVENEKISAGHARSLVGLSNAEQIARKIVDKKLTVRQSENLVRALRNSKNYKVKPLKDPNILGLEKSIEDKVGLKTEIKANKNNSGTLSFEYKTLDQLEKLIEIIKKHY